MLCYYIDWKGPAFFFPCILGRFLVRHTLCATLLADVPVIWFNAFAIIFNSVIFHLQELVSCRMSCNLLISNLGARMGLVLLIEKNHLRGVGCF